MVDYIVIGGGVYGVATAWWLKASGASVWVLESASVASAASGGPGRRGVRANARDVRELPLARRAYDVWPALHEQLNAAPFYERTGHLLLAETQRDVQRIDALIWTQRQHGIETERLDVDAIRKLEPGISEHILCAAYCPLDGVAKHEAVTHAYAQAAVQRGARILSPTSVAHIESTATRATGVVTTDGQQYNAKRGVLVLANAQVAELVRRWNVLPVWNEALQVLISEPMQSVPFRRLTGHMSRVVSLKREGENRVMLSGGWPGRWDTATQQGNTITASITANVQEAVAVYPQLSALRVETADAGHQESFTIDGVPIIDLADGLDNLWFATGWCGHGWAIAPVVAELLARWVVSGQRPTLLAPFSLRRFDAPAAID